MKKLTILLALLFPILLNAQESKPKSIFKSDLFRNLHVTYATMDLYYTSSEIHSDRMNGFGFGMGATINNFWTPGFTFEFYNSRSIEIDVPIPVLNSVYNTSLIEFSNEFVIGSNQVVSLGFPLRFGWGYTNYFDKYDNEYYNRSIVDDSYFVADAGINLYINIFKGVSLAGGANYRYASGVQRVGTDEDFTNYSFSGRLRFRMFDLGKKEGIKPGDIQ